MTAAETTAQLGLGLEAHGFKYKMVSMRHLNDLRDRIHVNIADQSIADPIYQLYKDDFEFASATTSASAQTIIIVAAPQPKAEIVFTIGGKKLSIIVPPTYHNDTDALVVEAIERVLAPSGWHLERIALPLKLLAVHSGLAKYGKNNIAYIDGMGSFFRLAALATDFPVLEDSWQEMQALDLCARCTACIRKCPTGAIDADRFIIRAERCLTYHTESSADFPAWIDKSWHHCLVGCMRCQTCCPANKTVRSWSRVVAEFSEEETSQILLATSPSDLSADLLALVKRTGLSEYLYALIPRNLRALVNRLPAEAKTS